MLGSAAATRCDIVRHENACKPTGSSWSSEALSSWAFFSLDSILTLTLTLSLSLTLTFGAGLGWAGAERDK